MARIKVRKGMPSVHARQGDVRRAAQGALPRSRLRSRCKAEIDKIIDAAWDGYDNSRKSPLTQAGRPGLCRSQVRAVGRMDAPQREAIRRAERQQKSPSSKSRILLINGSPRSDQTCPGEMSKSFRLMEIAEEVDQARARLRGRAARPQPPDLRVRHARSIPARPASRPRCRSATGRAPAIPTIRSARPTTG